MTKMSLIILVLITLFMASCGSDSSVNNTTGNQTSNQTAQNSTSYTKVLYNSNIDTNSLPTYSIYFGSPEIVGPIGQFTTNSLSLNSLGNIAPFYYDQIRFQIDEPGSPYVGLGKSPFLVSFDVITKGLVGTNNQFVVLFDAPSVRNLVFSGDGTIAIINIGTGTGNQKAIASFINNEKKHVDMYFDIKNDLWKVYIDDKYVYGDVIKGESLVGIRFSQGAKTAENIDYNATAYIDNILISSIPL